MQFSYGVPMSCPLNPAFTTSAALAALAQQAEEAGFGAAYVTEHELAVEGPVREYYPVDARSTDDAAQWRTEIGWPIFGTGAGVTRS